VKIFSRVVVFQLTGVQYLLWSGRLWMAIVTKSVCLR